MKSALQRIDPAHAPEVWSLIKRYASRDWLRMGQFASSSSRCVDLLTSFPVACVALVRRRGCAPAREEALQLVCAGAPIAAIADALSLPMWMRKLPPETLHCDIPAVIGASRRDEEFGRVIANCFPETFRAGSSWLAVVLKARQAGGDDFAGWLASHLKRGDSWLTAAQVRLLGAYAFYSTHPDATHFKTRFCRPWTNELSLHAALQGMSDWMISMLLHFQAQARELSGAQSRSLNVQGFDFRRLETYEDLVLEGSTLSHCLGTYAPEVTQGDAAVFGASRSGAPCATVELTATKTDGPLDRVGQVVGPSNTRVSAEFLAALQKWFLIARTDPEFAQSRLERIRPDPQAWRQFWTPYWARCGDAAIIPRMPSGDAADRIIDEVLDATRPARALENLRAAARG